MTQQDAYELLEQVHDAASLSAFVQALIADRQNPQTRAEWQNDTIEHFLESALAWAASTDYGLTQEPQPTNEWQRFALFLWCGKIYE
jgi:uncharacterized protein YfiM (DUF2279 family)